MQISFFLMMGMLFFLACTKTSGSRLGDSARTSSSSKLGGGTGSDTASSTSAENSTKTGTGTAGTSGSTGQGSSGGDSGSSGVDNGSGDSNLYNRNIAKDFPLPADQDPLTLNIWANAAAKDCNIRANRPAGDICGYDFCGLAKESLSDEVYTTVKAIVDFLKAKQLYPTSNCRNSDVVATLKTLKGLDLSSKNISDISPLYQMVSLEKLILDHNSIQDMIYLSRMPALKVLSVTFNKLLSLRGLDSDLALEEVYVTNNQIQQVTELADLPKLTTVDISNNQVQSVVVLITRSNRIKLACAGNPGIITSVKAATISTSTQSGSCFHTPTGFADYMSSASQNLDCIWGGVQFIAYTISTTPLY